MFPKSTALKIYLVKIPLTLQNGAATEVVGYRKDTVKRVFENSVHMKQTINIGVHM